MTSFVKLSRRFSVLTKAPQYLQRIRKSIPFPPKLIQDDAESLHLNKFYSPFHSASEHFAPNRSVVANYYSNNLSDYDRFKRSTVGIFSRYNDGAGNIRHCTGTGVVVNKKTDGNAVYSSILTAYHNVYEYCDSSFEFCAQNDAAWINDTLLVTRTGIQQESDISNGCLFDHKHIVWYDQNLDLALLTDIQLPFDHDYMEIQNPKGINFDDYQTLVMCAINPLEYPSEDNALSLSQDSSFDTERFDYNENEYKMLYGDPSTKCFVFSNKSFMKRGIFDYYIKMIKEKGIPFDLENKLIAPSRIQENCCQTMIPGITGHSGGGISAEPGTIFSVFVCDYRKSIDEAVVEMLVAKIPKEEIESHF